MKTTQTTRFTKIATSFALGVMLLSTVALAAPLIIFSSVQWVALPSCTSIKVTSNPTTTNFYGSNIRLYWRKHAPVGNWNATGIAPTTTGTGTYTFNVSSIPGTEFPVDLIMATNPTNIGGNLGSTSAIKLLGARRSVVADTVDRHRN